MVNKKISRKEAISIGQKVYWREKACPQGHSGWFRVGGGCVQCQRETSNRYKNENKEELREKRKIYLESEQGKEVLKEYMENGGRESTKERMRKWRKNNPDKVSIKNEQHKIYMQQTKEERSAARKKHYEKNKERLKEKQREYLDKNREKIRESRRGYYREYMRKRRENDPTFKVLTRMRDFNRRCVEAIRGVKNWRTATILGYTPDELRLHIESQWQDGMSWENYGEWHIDHIKSIKQHLNEGIDDIKIINALTNLQPLWAFDNLSKGA